MNREQALLLTVLGDFLHQRKTVAQTQDCAWSALFRCGEKHRLNGIVYCQLGKQIPEPFYSEFHTEYLASIVRYRHRQVLVGQMEEVLRRSGVDYFFVKGDLIGALYTNPMLRSVSDVDLVVPADRLASLHDPLTKAGFERIEKGKSVWAYRKETVTFELHRALIFSTHREDDAIADYLHRCWDSVEDGKLDWNFHMIYLLLHLRKHFRSSGVGFRQFLDLAFVAQKIPLDWAYIRREMEGLGLWRFTLTVMNLCDVWFDTHCAPEKLELNRESVERATDTIFRNGIFGYANEENKGNDFVNAARSDGLPGLLKQLQLLLFPGYLALHKTRKFGFLYNRPWLLPLAWLKRYFLLISEHKAVGKQRSLIRIRHTIGRRNDTYDEWGL